MGRSFFLGLWIISTLTSITTLALGKCSFSESRKEMHCGNEHFKDVPYELIQDANFESLYMELNNLTVLKTTEFSQLQYKESLKELYLFNNQIENIYSNSFSEVPNLETIDVSYNKLKKIDNQFHSAVNLINLDLAVNPIESVSEDAFRNLEHLRFLSLKDCNISVLPINFLRGSNLTKLDLSGNYIQNFDEVYWPPSLVTLIPPEKEFFDNNGIMNDEGSTEKGNEKKANGTGNNVRINFYLVMLIVFSVTTVL